MSHPESKTAVLTDNEPPDGTKLIVTFADEWWVIVRDDRAAREAEQSEGEHWFNGDSADAPKVLSEWLSEADAVYALGEKLAQF